MTTIICITILAYCILGKDIKALMEKVGDVDWKRKADEVMESISGLAVSMNSLRCKAVLGSCF